MAGCASAPRAATVAPRIAGDTSVPTQWWRSLGSPRLDSLIEQAFTASPTLGSAEATLRQAQELYRAQSGSTQLPQVDATLGDQRQRLNPAAMGLSGEPREFELVSATVAVRYKLDLSGGNRRALEALTARADYRRFQRDGARLTLAAGIAGTAVTQARLAAQVEGAELQLRIDEELLAIARERARLGVAAPDEVLALEVRTEQRRAGIVPQRRLLQQNAHLLAVLAGRAPGAGGVPSFTMSDWALPGDVPPIVPSSLVRQRPDIRAAEALMQAAHADHGMAVARRYPQLNLSANAGSQALTAGALFGGATGIWSLVAQLTQPLFNAGLPAEQRAALAAFDAAAANYQGVVLESLRSMADVLSALDTDAQAVAALARADDGVQATLASVQRQYALGAVSYLQVLAAQQQAQQSRLDLIAARAQRLVDTVALHQAAGGALIDTPSTARTSP